MYQSLTNTYRDIFREENIQEKTDVEVLLEQIQQLDEISLSRALRVFQQLYLQQSQKRMEIMLFEMQTKENLFSKDFSRICRLMRS